ncbi:MAG: hypothetical protein ACE5JX_11290 [Acidobacteriota bacterium]
MKTLRGSWVIALAFLLVPEGMFGQESGSRKRVIDARGASRGTLTRGVPRPTIPVQQNRGTPSVSSSRPGGTTSTGSRSVGFNQSPYTSYEQGRRIRSSMKRIYGIWPGYRYGALDLYHCNQFYRRLLLDYGFLPRYDYLGVFAQGSPALTPEVAQLALRRSAQASAEIVLLSGQLEQLLTRFEAGETTRQDFDRQLKEGLSRIRRLAKSVRKDSYLAYLDQRKDRKLPTFPKAASLSELRLLLRQLNQRARQMEGGLSSFSDQDRTRVVSVSDLVQPSFKSISKGIDKLAKTIQKSAQRL